jgi:hypothetical protein
MSIFAVGGQGRDSLAAGASGGYKARMPDVAYQSRIRIERVKGPIRRAFLPAEQQPVIFGVHGAVAKHYKVAPDAYEPHATTLDYVIAAAAG